MSEPSKIYDFLLDFDPTQPPPEDISRQREVAERSVASHIAGLLEARAEVMAVEAADPAIRLATATEIKDELARTYIDREEHKRHG